MKGKRKEMKGNERKINGNERKIKGNDNKIKNRKFLTSILSCPIFWLSVTI